MSDGNKIKIFLVDDDALFLKSLAIDFSTLYDYDIETFSTGELCIANLFRKPDIIILDYQLDGVDKNAMNGIATLDRIIAFNREISVIMLSSQDKIEVAVSCMHHLAFDYVIKSETAFLRLQKNISAILQHKKMQKELSWYMDKI